MGTLQLYNVYKIGKSSGYARWLCYHSERPQTGETKSLQTLMKFSEGNCKALHLERRNPMHQEVHQADWLQSW